MISAALGQASGRHVFRRATGNQQQRPGTHGQRSVNDHVGSRPAGVQRDHQVRLAGPGRRIRDIRHYHFDGYAIFMKKKRPQARDGVATGSHARRLALDHAHARRSATRRQDQFRGQEAHIGLARCRVHQDEFALGAPASHCCLHLRQQPCHLVRLAPILVAQTRRRRVDEEAVQELVDLGAGKGHEAQLRRQGHSRGQAPDAVAITP